MKDIFEYSEESDTPDENLGLDSGDEIEPEANHQLSGDAKRVIRDIATRTQNKPKKEPEKIEEDDVDEDEYIPSTVDYQKKIDRAKEKSAAEIQKITNWEHLNSIAQEENRKAHADAVHG